ncbi:hypothetical protein HBI22_249990 [Parastagonospora nodorum]|nr:hypothetical protein HBI28_248690 [Parastagonospora nodorum]KAH5617671.1 hypothetical protein HBI22_249990 [Parastagonospora nodorum]
MSSLLPALKFSSIERYSRSYILCPCRVSLIYPPLRFVLLLLLCRPVRQHHKTPLILIRLVAYAACRNRADLNPLPPQRRRSLVARQCRRRRNAAQQI